MNILHVHIRRYPGKARLDMVMVEGIDGLLPVLG